MFRVLTAKCKAADQTPLIWLECGIAPDLYFKALACLIRIKPITFIRLAIWKEDAMRKLKILADDLRLARTAGEFFANQSQEAIAQRGYFTVALAGGQTPGTLYSLLTSEAFTARIDWDKVHLFWGDERCVPPEHVESNYSMARHYLLNYAPIPEENIHRIQGELEPQEAARSYEKMLRDFFKDSGQDPDAPQPRFDLVLLGMGDDGHTASLFPYSDALKVQDRWVTAHFVESVRAWRVTLTASAINAAANIMFLVLGASKAENAQAVLQGAPDPQRLPSQMIQPIDGQLIWLLDDAAAALLDQSNLN